jgi:elongation factor G
MALTTELIRNVALAGHGGTGKTTLLEHLLFSGGAIAKPETIESGKTVSDYTEEEIAHKISIHAAFCHLDWNGNKINLLDTPGSSDFIGDVILAFRSCEMAILMVDGKSGVQIETIKLWRELDKRTKPRAAFISRLDEDRADFSVAMADIKDKFKMTPVLISIPMGAGATYKGVIDVLHGKAYPIPASQDQVEAAAEIPAEFSDAYKDALAQLSEAAADGDDELMEKYLDKGELAPEEIRKGLAEAFAANRIFPVLAGSSLHNSGCAALLDFIAEAGPSPLKRPPEPIKNAAGEDVKYAVDPDAPASALVIRTQIDQFSGRLSFLKVFSGRLLPDMEMFNVRENKKEKIGKLYIAQGKKLEEVHELCAGDIGLTSKVLGLKTNDTITVHEDQFAFLPLRLPQPVHALAISAVQKKEEDKMSELLHKASEEDLTFRVRFDAETKETVISGMGELQINMILDKIKNGAKIAMETCTPRVAYRETITKKAHAEYTHKKQTGGHGQFARVVLDIEPLERGKVYEFENKIFGGAVSKGFIPGIEKGVHQAMEAGVVAGYPVVDVKTMIVDGKEHPVDSSEMAFKLASRGAFRECMREASPVLLEPVMNLTVFADEKYLGDIMSDLSGRRGRISGQQPVGGDIVEVKAQAPNSELLRYSIDLRAMTSGTGSFELAFDHYAPISGKIAEDVIKAAQGFKVQEEEEE